MATLGYMGQQRAIAGLLEVCRVFLSGLSQVLCFDCADGGGREAERAREAAGCYLLRVTVL